jgi:hypothetical protein
VFLSESVGFRKLCDCHIDARHLSALSDLVGGNEAIHPRAAAEINDLLAAVQIRQIDVVADASERFDGLGAASSSASV